MTRASLLSPVGEIVRRHDPDRYFCTLFAPPEMRETLFTLYAFNHELARAREVVREPFAALIRLQWWREVVDGARRRHEVAGPLADALAAGALDPAELHAIIDAREAEADTIETLADLQAYVEGAAGGVMVAAGRSLGMSNATILRPWGAACGVSGILRSLGAHARQGRCLLPRDLLREAGLSDGAVIADPNAAALAPISARLVALATSWLRPRVAVPRRALAAALPVTLARRDLARAPLDPQRRFQDRLAVVQAAITARP